MKMHHSREVGRADRTDESTQETGVGVAPWFLVGMVIVGLICLLVGARRHGVDVKNMLAAGGMLLTGIGFVAIGLLELEWLERLIGFVDGIFSGLVQWCWTSWAGGRSDSELVGRRGATVIWVLIGFPTFVWGCLLALRITGV